MDDRLAAVMLSPDVIDLLQEARALILPIFAFYVNQQEAAVLDGPDGKSRLALTVAKREMERAARCHMPMELFVRFSQDFELIPRMITRAQLSDAFRYARFGLAGASPSSEGSVVSTGSYGVEDLAKIGIDEFVEAIGRLALMAFRYKELPEPLPTLGFQGSYQAAAKSMWLDEAHQKIDAEANLPNLVHMPEAAAMEHPIGHDDRAREDVVYSRAASRCFSRAKSTVSRSGISAGVSGRNIVVNFWYLWLTVAGGGYLCWYTSPVPKPYPVPGIPQPSFIVYDSIPISMMIVLILFV